jgi:hypothetical protein
MIIFEEVESSLELLHKVVVITWKSKLGRISPEFAA